MKLERGLARAAIGTIAVGLACLPQLSSAAATGWRHTATLSARQATLARGSGGVTVVLAGGSGPDELRIWLSADGRTYWISSSTPLETGGGVCSNPPGEPDQLTCAASAIAAFQFNGGPGDNTVITSSAVPVPMTLRGGSGNNLLVGGGGGDTLIGGPGENVLIGGPGDDLLRGGSGDDLLIGGPGRDVCNGGGGENAALGCEVEKNIAVTCASIRELRAPLGSSPCARWARRHPAAISRLSSLRRRLSRRSAPPSPRPRVSPRR